MGTTRRQYTAEFKREAVAAAAQNLGITPKLLSCWRGEQQRHQEGAFPGQGHQTPEHTELRQLRADNRRLWMERDIFKKATAFSATHGTCGMPSFTRNDTRIRCGSSVRSCQVSRSGYYQFVQGGGGGA